MEDAKPVVTLNSTDPLTLMNDEKLRGAWSQIREVGNGLVDSY